MIMLKVIFRWSANSNYLYFPFSFLNYKNKYIGGQCSGWSYDDQTLMTSITFDVKCWWLSFIVNHHLWSQYDQSWSNLKQDGQLNWSQLIRDVQVHVIIRVELIKLKMISWSQDCKLITGSSDDLRILDSKTSAPSWMGILEGFHHHHCLKILIVIVTTIITKLNGHLGRWSRLEPSS